MEEGLAGWTRRARPPGLSTNGGRRGAPRSDCRATAPGGEPTGSGEISPNSRPALWCPVRAQPARAGGQLGRGRGRVGGSQAQDPPGFAEAPLTAGLAQAARSRTQLPCLPSGPDSSTSEPHPGRAGRRRAWLGWRWGPGPARRAEGLLRQGVTPNPVTPPTRLWGSPEEQSVGGAEAPTVARPPAARSPSRPGRGEKAAGPGR